MSEFFFYLIAVIGKIGEGVHIVCSNVFVGGASSRSLTGKMPVPQTVIFFGMDRHYQHNFFPKRRQVRYDVISRSVLAGSSR